MNIDKICEQLTIDEKIRLFGILMTVMEKFPLL